MKKSLGADALGVPAPVWVVGSYGPDREPNVMVASWGGICCSSPPCLAVSLRKTRLSHANIMKSKAFTVNVPSRRHLPVTDYIGTVSGRSQNKFAATGLTPVPSSLVEAPYILEFPLVLECTLFTSIDLGSHTQFIGRVVDVKADEAMLDGAGALIAGKVNPLIASPAERAYYALGNYLTPAHAPGLAVLEHRAARQGKGW